MSPEELELRANRLDELGRLLVRSFIEWDPRTLAELATEFDRTKRDIQAYLIEFPSAQLVGEDAAKARSILSKVAAGESLVVEDALLGKLMNCGLDEEDLEEIGTQELNSWMSHIDYAQGLFKAGALIVNCGTLPSNLSVFLNEARQCFAFQQYNAVSALSRTMLEIAVKDIETKCSPPQPDPGNVVQIDREQHRDLKVRINSVTHRSEFSHFRRPLHDLRLSGNRIVHGGRTVDETTAIQTLRETLRMIRLLYEVEIGVVA